MVKLIKYLYNQLTGTTVTRRYRGGLFSYGVNDKNSTALYSVTKEWTPHVSRNIFMRLKMR